MAELDIKKENDLFERKETKGDRKNRTLMVQLLVCTVAVLIIFGLSRSSSDFYKELKTGYEQIMSEDMCADGILSTAQKLFYMAFGKSEMVGLSESARTEERTSKGKADTKETEFESETEETVTALIDDEAKIDTITSAGGEDIRVLDALADSTFEPVHISQEAVIPVQGTVTSGFGYRIHPITGNKSFHTGIDIAASEKTAIAAAYDGMVTQTGYTSGKGNYILMSHAENLQTLYCHLSEIKVEEGAVIRAGETIGLVGSTGMSTGPHLHFELRVDKVRCDPAYVLKGLSDEV